ncbi:MAG: DNA replication and repair protein RecF, partial [Flavobacteriales bacterium]|nr:DNA replication and repair protein RecF [Flavobacteriales bacterium]
MNIEKISLVNFKNHESINLDFDNKLNFIFGENGVGKTN